MGSVERRKKILQIICRRGHETITNLAAEFGVSNRTIQRDIEAMSLYEPIYTKNGRYDGGVYLTDGYKPDQNYFDNQETELLQQIVSQTEKNGVCSLSKEQLAKLKKIILSYSKPNIS